MLDVEEGGPVRITSMDTLQCDAGWRDFSFLKVTTDTGVVGWAEFTESHGNRGLAAAILALGETLIGKDPRPVESISATLQALTRQVAGGMLTQAIAAIENALLDIKGKDLGVPVYELLGGPVRTSLPLYWSHCGSYRMSNPDVLGKPRPTGWDDVADLGREARDAGYFGLKANILDFERSPEQIVMPGFTTSQGFPELNADPRRIALLHRQINALREGAGPDLEIFLDLNFNFKTEGFLRIGRALEDTGLGWLELDSYDPEALATIRRGLRVPVASGESLHHRRQYLPFLQRQAFDVAIVDIVWNGLLESVKIASLADAFEVNVAPHNFYGHLASNMAAHFSAVVPNLRIMEIDVDDVPWRDDLVTNPPVIENGRFALPTGPGWGTDIDEDAVRAHPVTHRRAHS